MLFVVKLYPEITIKSRPVRRRLIRLLRRNLRKLLRELDENISVTGEWDVIDIQTESDDEVLVGRISERLRCTPGIAQFQLVKRYALQDLDAIAEVCRQSYAAQLAGCTFAVRCKRHGNHPFTSVDVERHVGAILLKQTEAAGVRLTNPEVTVQLEIRQDHVHVVEQQQSGIGGFPLGSQDPVLSLISGGFDSAVSSYLCIRRGLLTHYCFFNLGGRAHELAVKEVALYLWMKFGASHQVRFITVPFEPVVAEILNRVDNSQMGVILKRMMLRAASRLADQLGIQALVTGEAVAQVSSQTLPNLVIIDSVTDKLLLRPLIVAGKQDIIDLARSIGTEQFSSQIPEYCAVISDRPTTRARPERIAREEQQFNMQLIDQAVAEARVQLVSSVANDLAGPGRKIPVVSSLEPGVTLIDIRHPDERERAPLAVGDHQDLEFLQVPFYQLQTYLDARDRKASYLLYCDKGMMSRLHAAHLADQGFTEVGVYQPDLQRQ
ncbi:MAG: tRNA uracil 4-sulfurtransferase ThiI [Gammaproteobacteria bacterium]|nr:tRNA 4-thiouridine(8) synthase ThiI [Pseudomonadales bacterium]MCP5347304.1 tRNA 4-thiouridine(8) synthase ThiI [Pseudomonadales bacterium]